MSHCKENIKRLSQLSERKGRKRSNNAMTVEEIREKLKTSEYDFLRNNKHLGSNIILLGLGGSYSYGI